MQNNKLTQTEMKRCNDFLEHVLLDYKPVTILEGDIKEMSLKVLHRYQEVYKRVIQLGGIDYIEKNVTLQFSEPCMFE